MLDDDEGMFDVVAAHQERNRKPKAPSVDHLRQSAARQGRWPRRVPDSEEEVIPDSEPERDVNDPDDAAESDGSSGPVKKRAKRNSQHHDAKPTQLQFYPGHWRDVLERAKEFFRLWMIKECPFPQRDLHLVNAEAALKAAMEEFEENGSLVEDGKSMLAKSLYYWQPSPEYYPDHIHDMLLLVSPAIVVVSRDAQCLNNQIFEESSTYRGTLKAAARTIVTTGYNLHNAEFDEDRFSSQQGWWEYLESTARELIDNCTFLHQGEDDEVSVKAYVMGNTNRDVTGCAK